MIFGHVATKRGSEIGVVGNVWVTRDTEVVLYSALGWQPVVIPAHWVKHLLAAHAPETSNGVGVGVTKHVTHVQRATYGRWRRVNREYICAKGAAVERVGAFGFPPSNKFGLEVFEGGFFRHIHRLITVLARNWA